ncbi:hypothetical protein AADZ90_019225 [Aestuariibius sp. 2305UL40-4]|uniref:hypothetical protein n=1 Tax=Aestuariibius violaceus TaxID=3234132 RepID=UPI00345EE2FD
MVRPNTVASLWIGACLSPIEQLSLASFVARGNPVILYSYNPVEGVPDGVECRDAAEILPATRILQYRKGVSQALHSNAFRVELLSKTDAVWVDTDIVAHRTFAFDSPYIFAEEKDGVFGNAVFRLPATSPALRKIARPYRTGYGFPPDWPRAKRLRWMRIHLRLRYPIENWRYGRAPLHFSRKLWETGEARHALPSETFYPVLFADCARLIEPGGFDPGTLPRESHAVHLFTSRLKLLLAERYGGRVPEGSYLDRQLRAHGVEWSVPSPQDGGVPPTHAAHGTCAVS